MGYNYYNTEKGIITYINDDTLYSVANSQSTSAVVLFDGSNLTAAGTELKNLMGLDNIYLTVIISESGAWTRDVIFNGIDLLFPHNSIIGEATSGTSEINVNGASTNKTIHTTISSLSNNDANITVSAFLNNNGSIVYSPQSMFTYCSSYYSNNTINSFRMWLIVLNEAQTNGVILYFYSTSPNNIAVQKQSYLASYVNGVRSFFSDIEPYEPTTDPYAGAGNSDIGGGDGTFDGSSDPIPVPPLPTVGATDAGFITLFAPTTTQLKNLAYTCWVGLLDSVWTNFRKLFSDPMDCILGLSVVPVSVPTSGVQDVAIGNIPTGVSMNVASQQYIEVDCGTVSFASGYFGSYLDYEPYTKIAIYLPYVGVHQLNTDDIMGRTIQVVYHIDILTGSCIAFVKCGDSVLYQFNGACASNIPVNSLNYASTIENAIRIAVNIGTTVATAGASAPLSLGAEGVNAGLKTAQNVARGVSMAGATAEGALSMKPSIGRSGSLGGTTGLMGTQYPYMIITRPRLCKPKNQNFYKGYPSFIQTTIGDLIGKGYTEFDTVIISTLYLTDDEELELETILKGGVYL